MIILAATPIGNLADASQRLKDSLAEADVIAAEDTRTAKKLLHLLEIESSAQVIALHDHNEQDRAAELISRAAHDCVVVISDAGMPTVSDPGFRLVRGAIAAGVEVTCAPGPSAVLTALALSGLPTDRFTFEGFVPRKQGERRTLLSELARERRTMVFFEAPSRTAQTLGDISEIFGQDRALAVCRELTKMHEEVRRGTAQELAEWAADGVRGEIVLVIAGAEPEKWTFEHAVDAMQELISEGTRRKDASRQIAEASGYSAKELYAASLR